jgi:hypothetical protein
VKAYGGVSTSTFLDLELSGRLHVPTSLLPGMCTWYPLDERLGGPQSLSGGYLEVKIRDPTGTLDRPSCSQSKYRLRYRGSYQECIRITSLERHNDCHICDITCCLFCFILCCPRVCLFAIVALFICLHFHTLIISKLFDTLFCRFRIHFSQNVLIFLFLLYFRCRLHFYIFTL